MSASIYTILNNNYFSPGINAKVEPGFSGLKPNVGVRQHFSDPSTQGVAPEFIYNNVDMLNRNRISPAIIEQGKILEKQYKERQLLDNRPLQLTNNEGGNFKVRLDKLPSPFDMKKELPAPERYNIEAIAPRNQIPTPALFRGGYRNE